MNEIKRPVLKPYSKDRFELVEPYSVTMPIFKSELVEEITVEVPKGYKTNGANIPRIFWSIFPPNSPEYLSAVVVHDYLCELKLYALADEALRHIMANLGVAKWKIYCFYYACRAWHLIKYGAAGSGDVLQRGAGDEIPARKGGLCSPAESKDRYGE